MGQRGRAAMADATLLFGIGAAKAGTSWLYRYLCAHPDCHLRTIKELHFFDAIDDGRAAEQLRMLAERRRKLARRQADAADDANRARRIAEIEEYEGVLASADQGQYLSFLNRGRGGERLIADITPAYALLSEGRLARMAGMSADVRFIYLLRDPVARLWSHVRMIAGRRAAKGQELAQRAGAILERALSGGEDHILQRGDYRGALRRMTSALDPSRLFLAFYEELFTGATIARLCAFLGIAPVPADFGARAHEGVPLKMTDAQRNRAAGFLRPQYEFVEASLGRLPGAWETNRVGV